MSLIESDIHKLFKDIIKQLLISTLSQIDIHIEQKSYISTYFSYPVLLSPLNNWPDIHENNYFSSEPKDYSSLLSLEANDDKIFVKTLDGYNNFIQYITNNEDVRKHLWYPESKNNHYDIIAKIFLGEIVNRYIHVHNTTIFSEDFFEATFEECTGSYFNKELHFDICVPILMLEFEDDDIMISNKCDIKRMSNDFIQSKFSIGEYSSYKEKLVLNCATHMLVIKSFYIKNIDYNSMDALQEKSVYPIDIIESLMAAIRVIVDYPTGFAQIVSMPSNQWINRYVQGKLIGLIGAKAKAYPESFLDGYWLKPHKTITKHDCERITKIFLELIKNNNNGLNIAINRLNRCVLRSNEEDSILDAIIGLEILLTDNDKGELTYKISTRMAALSTLYNDFPYTPSIVKQTVSKIYAYRSDIVHGRKKGQGKQISITKDNEIPIVKLATDYLRYAIVILAEFPKYLAPVEIDNLIMQKISIIKRPRKK